MNDDIEVIVDKENLKDAGFDEYLIRRDYEEEAASTQPRQISADNIVGGSFSNVTEISIGTGGLIKIDAKNKRILISDGANDRVLIGYQRGGF